jgi:predicted dehydrogenase
MTLSIAFFGTGYISQIHAKTARKLTGVEMVAVVNHRPELRADFTETFGIPRQYTTVEELLRDGLERN